MFIDASALCALLTDENDARELAARLQKSRTRLTSPSAIWETVVNVGRILNLPLQDVLAEVNEYLAIMSIQTVAIPPEATILAIEAFGQFGKGRHPASLNFGDCFAYACARHYRQPLLYKGSDFARTDIEAA